MAERLKFVISSSTALIERPVNNTTPHKMKTIFVLAALCAFAAAFPEGHDQHHGFAISHEQSHHGGHEGHSGKDEHGHSTSYANIERHDGKGHEVHFKAHPEYHYGYKIDDDKHHVYTKKEEERDGYKVKGKYSLVEPDGKTVRIVEYTADKKEGFNAKVSYKHHH